MPPGGVICKHPKLCETLKIFIGLDLQVGAGNLYVVLVSQFLPGQFHAVQHHAGCGFAYGVDVKVKACLVQCLQDFGHLCGLEGCCSGNAGVHIGRNHSSGFNLEGAVHKDFQGMHFQVLAVILAAKALHFLYGLVHLAGAGEHVAAVDVGGQFSFLVHLAQDVIHPLVDGVMLREAGVEDRADAYLFGILYPALEGRPDLIFRKVVHPVEKNGPAGSFERIAGYVAVLSYIIGKSGNRIRCIIGNAHPFQNLGVDPVAVALPFQED